MSNPLNIVCPHCNAINRVAAERLHDNPKCGKCHQPLFTGQPVELNNANFQKHLTRNDIPLLIDFWAPWCGPCKMMAPAFSAAAARLEPRVRLAKLNTEDEQVIAGQFGIRSIPTLMLFENGQQVAVQPGAMGEADIVRWTESNL